MPGLDGLAAAAVQEVTGLPVAHPHDVRAGYLRRAMESGAFGFGVKDAPGEQLADAISRVLAGEPAANIPRRLHIIGRRGRYHRAFASQSLPNDLSILWSYSCRPFRLST
jgi:DNA-binding NarL/FixJ family response regulator